MREIYVYAAFIMGMLGLVEYFVAIPFISQVVQNFTNWIVIISSCMLGMGAYSLMNFNFRKVRGKRKDWMFGVVCIISFILMLVLGIYVRLDISKPEYFFWYNSIVAPSNAALWSIALFYIVSASVRAMRPRNIDATVLLIGAVLSMFNNAPIFGAIHPALPYIGSWIFQLSAETGMRALLIGVAVGVTSMALRVIIGKERRALGGLE